jgi:tetratricopeptide (TPR) repeat protein
VDLTRRSATHELRQGRVDAAIATLERLREEYPKRDDVRLDLGIAYYRKAREALDHLREPEYLSFLAKSQQEFLESADLAPRSPQPHTWMGIVAVYQGDADRALRDFRNALRLEPRSPTAHTNLAELYVYRGEIGAARSHLDKARKMRVAPAQAELVETLAAWRQGDYVEAREVFDMLYSLDPDFVKNWNEAPLEDPIESFQDLTEFCCSHLACGPYMDKACQEMHHEVKRREVAAETLREELRLEMERQKRLRDIYRRERDVEIDVEPEPGTGSPRR